MSSAIHTPKSPKIVVVGAGIAGLTTAYRLQMQGMDVHVYEAKPRVGGRISTVKVGGSIGELGGQNITDGGESRNILRLIHEFKFELTSSRLKLNPYYYVDGKLQAINRLLKKKQFKPDELREQLNKLIANAQNMREIFKGILDEEDPLYKTLAIRLAAYEGGPIEDLSPLYAETLFHMLMGGVCIAHEGKGDAENYLDFTSIKGGNALLLEKIAECLRGRLHLNKPLINISKREGAYQLNFNGEIVIADILVLAMPCSVYEDIEFDDHVIPAEKLSAIQEIRYGSNAKILVPFTKSPERKSVISDRVVSFFDNDSKILSLYYTSSVGAFSSKTIHDIYAREKAMLELSFENASPYFVPSPEYADDRPFAVYEGAVGYSWLNDPYAKGSYCYIAPGQEALLTGMKEVKGELVKTLFEPIDHNLYFAGEHASILLNVPGTIEAACESGERTARMIAKSN
jgi:monoamine oxidase